MNKLKTTINGTEVELWYNNSFGSLEAVYKMDGTPLMMETQFSGGGYNVRNETGIIGSMPICDARYVHVPALKAFVPRLLFIPFEVPVPHNQDEKLSTML